MTVLVTRDQSAPMRQEIRIGSHTLAADAKVEEGGDSSALTPHDLYDAALGACKALTVIWYAKRKGIPVEGIEVRVERDSTQERAGTYRLDARLRLGGPLSAAPGAVIRRFQVPDPQAHGRRYHRNHHLFGRRHPTGRCRRRTCLRRADHQEMQKARHARFRAPALLRCLWSLLSTSFFRVHS